MTAKDFKLKQLDTNIDGMREVMMEFYTAYHMFDAVYFHSTKNFKDSKEGDTVHTLLYSHKKESEKEASKYIDMMFSLYLDKDDYNKFRDLHTCINLYELESLIEEFRDYGINKIENCGW